MPPHYGSMDGPVVNAARRALEREDVNLIPPYVKETASADVKSAFEKALRARKGDPAAREVADLYFFETAVRLHRAGEGAPYTGLKPAGLDVGPWGATPRDELRQDRLCGRAPAMRGAGVCHP